MKNWLLPERGQIRLLPLCFDDLLSQTHLARFVVEAVERLDLSAFLGEYDSHAHGSTPYHPSMLVSMLIYGYSTGTFSSRKIEHAAQYDVPMMFIAGGLKPDHNTISAFRKRHLAAFQECFVQALKLAQEIKILRFGTVALDGTKIKANASKHRAVSQKHAAAQEAKLRAEVVKLLALSEAEDGERVAPGINLPAEIARREDRIAKLEEAQREIAKRHAEATLAKYTEDCEAAVEKAREAAARIAAGERKVKFPRTPEPPPAEPEDKAQYNFTDPESRIMPDKGGFTQAYNAQAAVDTGTMLVVGHRVTQNPNDKKELLIAIKLLTETLGQFLWILADAGYWSAKAVAAAPEGVDLYVSPGRTKHGRTVEDLLAKPAPAPPDSATPAEKMRHKLSTDKGRGLYRLRKMTVEPVFGIIKSAMRFRQFSLRGFAQVQGEWALVCLAYNMKRMFNLKTAN